MAQHLSIRLLAWLTAGWLSLAPAHAENLADPTRPADLPAATATPGAQAEGTPQLIKISRDRTSAIIGGQVVRVGDSYAGGRVVKIGEAEVVLKSGSTYQTLKLFPGVDKTPSNRKVKQ